MSWIEVTWIVMASWSLGLGLIHLFIWTRQRSQLQFLLFCVLAVSVAAFGVFELTVMRTQTAQQYASAARWAQVPLTVVVLAILAFVQVYFGTGRAWLAYAAAAFRLVALVANFTTGETLVLREITGIERLPLAGGAVVSVPIGHVNPWIAFAQISNLLLIAYVADATIALWRRGGPECRRRAVLIGGALLVFLTIAIVMGVLIFTGSVRAPTPLTACFLVVVAAMGCELGWHVIRSGQLAREVHESEQRMDLAARAARLAFWSLDAGHPEIWLSTQGRALFGIADSGPVDLERFLTFVHPDDRDTLRTALQAALRSRGAFEKEVRVNLPASDLRWIAVRGQIGSDASGASALLRGVALDVTARWRLEQQAAQQRNELAHLSRVATLGVLSGSLAHEINQPLMGILSNAQAAQRFLAGDDVDLDEVREILADIVEDDKRAGEVIRRLRLLLKKGEVQHGWLEIGNVVDDVLRLTRNDLMNRDVKVTAELAADVPLIVGDRIQLQQVLLNLVVNACDAMERAEHRELFITTRCPDGANVEVSVSDRGEGVPPADLERIFEPFVTSKEHGMGLGLSVCRTIISAHHGRLWAENNADPGATFRFTLPLATDAK